MHVHVENSHSEKKKRTFHAAFCYKGMNGYYVYKSYYYNYKKYYYFSLFRH